MEANNPIQFCKKHIISQDNGLQKLIDPHFSASTPFLLTLGLNMVPVSSGICFTQIVGTWNELSEKATEMHIKSTFKSHFYRYVDRKG